MSQADFTLSYRRFIAGGALVALSAIWCSYGLMPSAVLAQSVTLPTDQVNSTRTDAAMLESEGSLIGVKQSKELQPESPNSALIAPTTTQVESALKKEEPDVVSDSMIKPSRPNGLLFKSNTQESSVAATTTTTLASQGSSLVEGVVSDAEESLKEIVIYFSVPEDVIYRDIDSLTGASLIEKDGHLQGITEYVAQYIGQKQDIPVYELSLDVAYPREHAELIERSNADLSKIRGAMINDKVSLNPEVDLSKVERIYLGFPLWWNDLPLAVYAFLQQTDLSGKTLLPFCTYGHNMPYQLFKRLKELEPNAKITRGIELHKQRLVKGMLDKNLERWLEDSTVKDSSSNSISTSTTTTTINSGTSINQGSSLNSSNSSVMP